MSEALAHIDGAGQAALFDDAGEPEPTIEVMSGPDRPLLVVALGLGRDSVAMLVLLWKLGIRPDLILFADVGGGEKPETYAYARTLNAWLRRAGFPEITVVRYENRKRDPGLEGQLLRLGTVPAVAFGGATCSMVWKQAAQKNYVKSLPAAQACWGRNRRVVFAIGFEADECKRVNRARTYAAANPDARFVNWFPLVEAGLDLDACVALIEAAGLPVPLKSACVFCPVGKRHEVEWLAKTHPGRFVRGLIMEARALPRLTTIKGLGGREFRWRDLECAAPYLGAVDAVVGAMPPPERDRRAQTSEQLRRAIERVLAIDDEEAAAMTLRLAA